MQTIDPISTVEITREKSQLNEVLDRQIRAVSVHPGWRGRYARRLGFIDWGVGLLASSSALLLRFGSTGAEPFVWEYLLLTLLFPLAWIGALGINRAYESRHLFVGTDEYARVVRSGIGLIAALAIFSFAFDLRLARGYVLIAVPLATLADVGARYAFRQILHR